MSTPGEEPIESPEDLIAAIQSDEERVEDYFNQRPTSEEFDDEDEYNAALAEFQQGKLDLPFTRLDDNRAQLRALGIDPYSFEPIKPGDDEEEESDAPPMMGPGEFVAFDDPYKKQKSFLQLMQEAVAKKGMPVRKPKGHAMDTKNLKKVGKTLNRILLRRAKFYETPAGRGAMRMSGQKIPKKKK
jgi:hypothetical protein